MISNELVHACIAALYHREMKSIDPDHADHVFLRTVRIYGEQRGHRMALRAMRDGKPLNYGTYMEYGEWMPSKMSIETGIQNRSKVEAWTPDYRLRITSCPWYRQFMEMGAQDTGRLYCSVLDESIARGFDPQIRYKVVSTLHETDHCMHVVQDSGVQKGEEHSKSMENVRPWSYHCAHLLHVFDEICSSEYGQQAETMKEHVHQELAKRFNEGILEELVEFEYTDFKNI